VHVIGRCVGMVRVRMRVRVAVAMVVALPLLVVLE